MVRHQLVDGKQFITCNLGRASNRSITKHGREYAAAIEVAFPFVGNLLEEGSVGD
jgi:hypothetical protein